MDVRKAYNLPKRPRRVDDPKEYVREMEVYLRELEMVLAALLNHVYNDIAEGKSVFRTYASEPAPTVLGTSELGLGSGATKKIFVNIEGTVYDVTVA